MRENMKMKHNLSALALAMTLTFGLTSCSDDSNPTENTVAKQVQSQSQQSDILSYIPADTPLLALYVKDENNMIAGNEKDQIEIITKYFEKMLSPSDKTYNIKEYPPTPMVIPYTKEEIGKAGKN